MAHSSFLRVCIIVSSVLIGMTAANAKAVKKTVKVAQAPKVETVSAIPIVQPEASPCRKVRRRFWIEEQGWIVRQVSNCS
jgi:hypothetical protein